jgi:TRAP transporter TAXI family solute receptor
VSRRLSRRSFLALAAATAACTSGERTSIPPGVRVDIATGEPQGFFFEYGRALTAVLADGLTEASVSTMITTGTVENLHRAVHPGVFGLAALDAAAAAQAGLPPFTNAQPLRAVGRLFDDYVHLVVPAESTIHRLPELRGRRVSLGPEGSGSELVAERVLAAAGLDRSTDLTAVQLGIDDALTQLEQGRIDALFWQGGVPTSSIVRLARRRPIRLVPLSSAGDAMRRGYGPLYRAASIPTGTYSNPSVVDTIAVPDLLVTSPGTDPSLVRRVAELIFDNRDRVERAVPTAAQLDRRAAISTGLVPLHDGALAYYRDMKI